MGGSLIYEEIQDILQNVDYKIDALVETGTYKGDTTVMASKHFREVFTFELNKTLFENSKKRFLEEKCFNISSYFGDSVELLQLCMPFLKERNCIYFLDAHISGHDSSYNPKYMVPLIQEIQTILSNIKENNIFIIDDARFWINENKPHDWSHINLEKLLDMFKFFNIKIKKHYLKNDRYIIIV